MIFARQGDCLELLLEHGPYDFIFADPPFNIGKIYSGYDDRIGEKDYERWTHRWIIACWSTLSQNGILALHGNDYLADLYLTSYPKHRIAWINWHYRFGQCRTDNWIDARCHCLVFAKNPGSHTWNPESVMVDSDRSVVYGDGRADPDDEKYEGGGRRLPGTVWGIPSDGPYWSRVQGNNKERVSSCPNQLPEMYLARLIRAYTNPGDLVCDPFGGSGTTAVVCQALGRRCMTFDVSAECVKWIRLRLRRGSVRLRSDEDARAIEETE